MELLDYKFSSKEVIQQNKTTNEDIDKIKIWLNAPKVEIVPSKIQDELIVLFLLCCNNNIEFTKKTISSYYKLRSEWPEVFDQRKMEREDIKKALKTMRMSSIPVRTDDNDCIIYFSLRDTGYKNFDILPTMKLSYMLMDLQQEASPPEGIILLVDMKGFGLRHLTRIKSDPLKKYFTYLAEGLSMKFKAMHFLNSNYFLEKVLSLKSIFLQPDVLAKLRMYKPGFTSNELFKFIPKKCLPKELEGDLDTEEELCETTIQALKNRENFFDVEEKLRKLHKK